MPKYDVTVSYKDKDGSVEVYKTQVKAFTSRGAESKGYDEWRNKSDGDHCATTARRSDE